jgi:hypothetical protein
MGSARDNAPDPNRAGSLARPPVQIRGRPLPSSGIAPQPLRDPQKRHRVQTRRRHPSCQSLPVSALSVVIRNCSILPRRLTAPPAKGVAWAAVVTSLTLEAEGPFRRNLAEAVALYQRLRRTG